MLKEKLPRVPIEERKVLFNEVESLAQMGSWKWTENIDELVWSDGLYKIFGKNPEEDVSWNTFLKNVFPEDALLVKVFLREIKINRKGSTINYRVVKDEHICYLSLTVKPHDFSNMNIFGTVVDITEQKEYEKQLEQNNLNQSRIIRALNEEEKKYRSLFERSIDPIFLASASFVLVDVNDSFLQLFEYNSIENGTVQDIFAVEDDYKYFVNTLKEIGQINEFEVTLITKTGEKKSCIFNCIFIPDIVPELCRYQGIIHDLTLRKQAEDDLLIAERLSLTGKIARTIAHEVRNPLTNLSLALDQLRDEMPIGNESAKLYGDIIERNANRIEQLVGEMLSSSKPKELQLELTTVNEIVEGAISLAVDRIKLNQVQLLTYYQDNLPRILVDKANIHIALLNIIINAIEAMMPGMGILKIDAVTRDNILTISIADNGKGIPASDLGKLFDPFFTGKQKGMGLGLTSAKNILNSHSAQIDVKSELHRGTTFYICFKLSE